MKVLFIGPYRQTDGWGEAARALIKSMLTILDIDLTLRHIYLARCQMLEDIQLDKLESKTNEHYDVIIQNCLPEFFRWFPNCKNIGFISTETCNLSATPWIPQLNLMDEIWVSSSIEVEHLQNSGCKTPIFAMGEATDTEKFYKKYDIIPNKNFTFYTIGEGERKNFSSLILAFHSEFDRNEPVDLVIKTSANSHIIQQTKEYKQTFGIYKNIQQYKTEKWILDRLSEDDLAKLHYQSDCFVLTSYGEAWCRPALDALGFGKTPIITNNIGPIDFINKDNGWIVNSYETPIVSNTKPLPYLYTARDTWYQIDILHLRKAMREAYANSELRLKKSIKGIQDVITNYSYLNIGKKIYDKLYK